MIWRLAGMEHQQGACITAQLMGIWPRTNSLVALLTYHKARTPALQPLIKRVNVFGDSCRGPSEQRNRIIHDPWYAETESGTPTAQFRSMPKSNPKFGLEDQDKTEFLNLLHDIGELANEAKAISREIGAILTASTQTPPSALPNARET
jgi:hypothetical protein